MKKAPKELIETYGVPLQIHHKWAPKVRLTIEGKIGEWITWHTGDLNDIQIDNINKVNTSADWEPDLE